MPAYLIIEATITDRTRFAAYATANPPLVARYGGRYLVLGGDPVVLEGEPGTQRLVVSEWPDAEAARRYWHSSEYAEVRKLREGCGQFRVRLVPGVEPGR